MLHLTRSTKVAILLIISGILMILGSIGSVGWSWNNIMNAGHGVTVPTKIDIDVKADEELAVWRELVGTHITLNRPLTEPPEDLSITIYDRQTGAILETRPIQLQVTQSIMPGFTRSRKTLFIFNSPPHGQITLDVSGSFDHEQVYRVAPSIRAWISSVMPIMKIGSGAGLVFALVGVGILIAKALKQERIALTQDSL